MMSEENKEKSIGRPVKYTDEKIQEIIALLNTYIEETQIPIIAEFCYKNNIRRQILYEIPELSDIQKRLIEKKEAQLERLGLEKNNTMAIFSLKQLGWRDTTETITRLDESEIARAIEQRLGLK